MIFDCDKDCFIYYRRPYFEKIDKHTFNRTLCGMLCGLQWMFRKDGITYLSRSNSVIEKYNSHNEFVSEQKERKMFGLVIRDQYRRQNIKRFDVETMKFLYIPDHLQYKRLSRNGELLLEDYIETTGSYTLGYKQIEGEYLGSPPKFRKINGKFKKVVVFDGMKYGKKFVLSTNLGLWYNGKFLNAKCIYNNFHIIGDYLYWKQNVGKREIVIDKFRKHYLISTLDVRRGEDLHFGYD